MDDFVNQLISYACDNNAALLHMAITGVLGLSVVASALANGRNHIPGFVVRILDWIALNYVKGKHDQAASQNER